MTCARCHTYRQCHTYAPFRRSCCSMLRTASPTHRPRQHAPYLSRIPTSLLFFRAHRLLCCTIPHSASTVAAPSHRLNALTTSRPSPLYSTSHTQSSNINHSTPSVYRWFRPHRRHPLRRTAQCRIRKRRPTRRPQSRARNIPASPQPRSRLPPLETNGWSDAGYR